MDNQITCWIKNDKDKLPSRKMVGGKALNLIRLDKLNVNVPRGFIIKTSVFKTILEIIFGCDYQNRILFLDENSIRLKILDSDLPEKLLEEIFSNLEILQKHNPSICLRSSNSVEDSGKASFAGQFLSILNLKEWQDIIGGINKIWASNFSKNAISYANYFDIDLINSSMAIIIQEFINAEKSGGLFTVSPNSKNYNHLIIESNYGLGVSTVDNIATPDRYTINKQELKIINKEIGKKEFYTTADSKKGILNIKNDLSRIQNQSLSDEDVIKIAKLGMKIEEDLRAPQDIEWATLGNQIFILQSRSITTL